VIDDLAAGELMIWEGRPQRLRGFLRAFDLFWIVFAALGALFFVTSLAASSRGTERDPGTYVVFAMFPFVVFGVFIFAPRLASIWREARGASYALTDKRIILRTRGRRIDLDLRTLPYLELERSWISGPTIYFAQRNIYEGWGGLYGGSAAPALRGLLDADDVYRKISAARSQATAR